MNCHELHLEASKEARLCLLRTPLLPELRRLIVWMLDDLDWAPQLIIDDVNDDGHTYVAKVRLNTRGWIVVLDHRSDIRFWGGGDTCGRFSLTHGDEAVWVYVSKLDEIRRIALKCRLEDFLHQLRQK